MLADPLITILSAAAFLFIFGFTAWLKFHEHLHLHRHEHGPHSSHTVLHHKVHRRRRSHKRSSTLES